MSVQFSRKSEAELANPESSSSVLFVMSHGSMSHDIWYPEFSESSTPTSVPITALLCGESQASAAPFIGVYSAGSGGDDVVIAIVGSDGGDIGRIGGAVDLVVGLGRDARTDFLSLFLPRNLSAAINCSCFSVSGDAGWGVVCGKCASSFWRRPAGSSR